MRYFFTIREPQVSRILLVESGSRGLLEGIIPGIRKTYGDKIFVDLVTCYSGLPAGLDPRNTIVYRVTDYRGRAGRARLYRELARNRYAVLGIICSAEPIMTKWKWMLAHRIPAKLFIINENADYFWFHRENSATLREFALVRGGLYGSDAPRTIGRLLIFPFAVIFLLLYAAQAHTRRLLTR